MRRYIKGGGKSCKKENFENKAYSYSFDCRLILDNCDIKVKIAIPYNWEIELIDFYISDKEFPFIPHMELSGKLCLFELERV